MSLVERLAEKRLNSDNFSPYYGDVRWWINAIADEMDKLVDDDAADLYDAANDDNIPKWLRTQAEEE